MNSEKNSQVWQYKWHIAAIVVIVAGALALSIFTKIFDTTDTGRQLLVLMGALIFLIALLTMLSRVVRIASTLNENSVRLEEATKAMEAIRDGLLQISHSTDADFQPIRNINKSAQGGGPLAQMYTSSVIMSRIEHREFAR